MQMNKQGWCLIMVNKAISLVAVLFFCGFISFIAINGTNEIYGKNQVQNITYKLQIHGQQTFLTNNLDS